MMLSAAQIRQLREALGMTRKTFGDLFGVGIQAVYHWEHGETHPKFSAFEKMNELLEKAKKEHGLVLT